MTCHYVKRCGPLVPLREAACRHLYGHLRASLVHWLHAWKGDVRGHRGCGICGRPRGFHACYGGWTYFT